MSEIKNICLFEDGQEAQLRPLISTKPIIRLRNGAFTLGNRIAKTFPDKDISILCRKELADLVDEAGLTRFSDGSNDGSTLFLNSRLLINRGSILSKINEMVENRQDFQIRQKDVLLASRSTNPSYDPLRFIESAIEVSVTNTSLLDSFAGLLSDHGAQIIADTPTFSIEHNPIDAKNFSSSSFRNVKMIFAGDGLDIEPFCFLDATSGPILIEENVSIKSGTVIYGPSFIGANTIINPKSRLKEVVIGPWCKIGGEVSRSTFEGYSNKGHDGYVGNSYVSQWCNIGANTNTSNLRNDYGPVKLFNELEGKEVDTGLNFAGLIMADHSKCSINTMFNTGSVIGVSCNLFGNGFHDRHIKSFIWGKPGKYLQFRTDKALAVAERMMARRGVKLGPAERSLLESIAGEGS